MSQTLSPSLARCYGLARVARAWKISRASVYRSLKETPPNPSAVPGLTRAIRSFVPQLGPRECANYFRHAGYASI